MANKPFAIQGADLTLGGVNLQAGTTGVVIPGVTQATSYKVEEVEDTGDQTHSFVDFPVFIIDYVTYLDYDNTGSSSNRAVYLSDTLDDEGYIDGISVDDGGSYTSNESNVNDGNDLYAYIGTDSANRFTAFVPTDWLQIPFRPKMRAGEVETIGGGGGGSSITNSDNSLTIDGDGNAIFQGPEIGGVNRGLVWDYGAAVDGGTNSMVRQDQNGLSVKAWTEGDGGGPTGSGNDGFSATVNIRTNRGADEKWWRFRGDGSIAFPDGSEQTTAYTGQAPRSFLVHEYSDPEPTSVPETIYIDGMEYGGGEIVNDGAFGQNSSRVTVYADSMFAMIALNTDINAVYYNGEFGSDGSGTKSVSSGLENYRDGYYSWYNKLSGDDPCVTQIVIAKNPTTPG